MSPPGGWHEPALDRAMGESNLIRWLVQRARHVEMTTAPTLTNAPSVGDEVIDRAWADVDRAMRRGGYLRERSAD